MWDKLSTHQVAVSKCLESALQYYLDQENPIADNQQLSEFSVDSLGDMPSVDWRPMALYTVEVHAAFAFALFIQAN